MITSHNNQFEFNLPSDFLSEELENKYAPLLKKQHLPYSNVYEYLNSTIKDAVFPNMSFESASQTAVRGAEVMYKSAKNVHNAFTREIDISFSSMNGHLNYFILVDAAISHYLDTEDTYLSPLIIHILDKDSDVIHRLVFRSVNIRSVSELRLSYSDQLSEEHTFTISFYFNWLDIIFVPDGKDIITNENKLPPPAELSL